MCPHDPTFIRGQIAYLLCRKEPELLQELQLILENTELDFLALGTMPKNPVAVKTIVTTDICKKIAAEYNVELREVLTGFKFIGEQIRCV